MRNRFMFTAIILLGLIITDAHGEDVSITLTGGFAASVNPAVATGEDRQAFTYQVHGASVLKTASGTTYRLSVNCVGYDEVGEGTDTEGSGRCTWSDADGHSIYVVVTTVGNGNRYTCTGGSGKWNGARCEIDTTFTYLPSPDESLFLGTDEGNGTLSLTESETP